MTCSLFSGATTQIRTGDLILTKDVLYQLSHSSDLTLTIIAVFMANVKCFLRFFEKLFFFGGGAAFSVRCL